MLDSEEYALTLADMFYSAAIGAGSWVAALEALATATGSKTGEIITIGANAAVPINVMTNTDPALHADFVVQRVGDPAVNPRVRAGMAAPVLKVLAENDFITPEEHKVHPHYRDFARPWDIPYICLSTLDRSNELLVGLAVCRSQSEGHITDEQRHVFAQLAPHVRAAIRVQMSLAEQASVVMNGVFESLSLPAFLCDRSGRVQSMTSTAESLVAQGHTLQVKNGRLQAASDSESKQLSDAIEAAADATDLASRVPRSAIVRSKHPASAALLLDIIRLPAPALEIHSKSQVLVMPQGAGSSDARRRMLLQTIYRLTAAEIEVAMHLAQGRTAECIAAGRKVSIATIRAQIKGILAKFGLTRQIELIAKLCQL